MIHFDGPVPVDWQLRRRAGSNTYCGMYSRTEPNTDTKLEKVTCGRCRRIRARLARPKMKVMRVSYRATFMGLKKGPLNLMGVKYAGPVAIEIFESTGGHWKFRAPHNGAEISELGTEIGKESAMGRASQQFDSQSTPWQMIGDPGDGKGRRAIFADEVTEIKGKIYFLESGDKKR